MSVERPSVRLTRVLAMAAAAALLASALPAAMVVTAKADSGCKVHNLGKAIDRDSLQKAVRAADPGDALLVQGTCIGTTMIDKDLDISFMGWAGAPMPLGEQYVVTPESQVTSGGAGPALVIDTDVDHFTVNPGLLVADGIVIGDAEAWDASVPSMVVTIPGHSLGDCHLRNDDTAEEFVRSQEALDAATPSAQLSLRGACAGETVVDEATRVAGWRIAISSLTLGGKPAGADDSGPATLSSVSVDAGVDSLVLRDVQVPDGFRISELTPAT
jgi:hypothetical protein